MRSRPRAPKVPSERRLRATPRQRQPKRTGIARQIGYTVLVVVPNRAGDGYVANEILLDPTQNQLMATINRQALIVCFEPLFGCVEIFGDQLAFAKHLLKRWPHN